MLKWLQNAFATEPAGPLQPSEAEQRVVEKLVAEIVRRGLTTPALIFLECSRPFNFVASQFMIFAGPVAQVIFRADEYQTWVRFLDRRGCIEYICRRVEALSADFDARRGRMKDESAAKRPAGTADERPAEAAGERP